MSAALATAGYAGTPLAQKLGLRDGQRVLFLDLPESLAGLAESRDFAVVERGGWWALASAAGLDYVHGFTTARAELEAAAKPLRKSIAPGGTVWISWPKRASRVLTDINGDALREVLLPTGLVDVKVAAIDDIWSGLKFMIRRQLR